MKKVNILLLLAVLFITGNLVMAGDPGSDAAECVVNVTVNQIIDWAGNFANINLAQINAQTDAPNGNQTQTLYVNCNIEISADNTTAARLDHGSSGDSLVTKYDLAEDGDGSATTGADGAAETASGLGSYVAYDSFLTTALAITHVDNDGAVDVTLYAEASNNAGEVADAGAYTATQTLTASWTSD